MKIEVSTQIAAPLDRIWAELVDVESWPEWTASMSSVARLDEGPLRVGSSARIKQPRLAASVWTVTELEPNRSFTWGTSRAGLSIVADHELSMQADGTASLVLRVEQSGIIGKLTAPLLAGTARRYVEMEAQGLKKRVESGSGT